MNLIPDAIYVPSESIRTFYIDRNWFKTFIDGAISTAEHYEEGDALREAIKKSLDTYLNTPLSNVNYKPLVPTWGFIVRSQVIKKFPNLRISAPRPQINGVDDPKPEILKWETIDQETVMALFDREPGHSQFPGGISFHPPEHQLTSMFGSIDGLQMGRYMAVDWTPVSTDLVAAASHNVGLVGSTNMINITDPTNAIFDAQVNAICTDAFAAAAQSALDLKTLNPAGGLVAAQLLRKTPELQLTDTVTQASAGGLTASAPSLSTSRPRPRQALTATDPVTPAPTLTTTLTTLPVWNAPVSTVIQAIQKVDLVIGVDNDLMNRIFWGTGSNGPIMPPQANTKVTGPRDPLLCTSLLNIQAPVYNLASKALEFKNALINPMPTSLGFKTDIHIPMISTATSTSNLRLVCIEIAVGTASNGFLLPFPTNPKTSSPTLVGGEYAQMPTATNLQLPNVRFVGLGNRWKVRTLFLPSAAGPVPNFFEIFLLPNTGTIPRNIYDTTGYWDINVHRDLGLVIEGVQLNPAMDTQASQVEVIETYYTDGNDHTGTADYAVGISQVNLWQADVTESDMQYVTPWTP